MIGPRLEWRALKIPGATHLNPGGLPTTHSNKSYDAYYGLDAHQKTISVARALPHGESEYVTTLPNREKELHDFFTQELETYPRILTAYEAGGCGFFLHHFLLSLGLDNIVIAPSLIPKIPGKRRKNDKIDAIDLGMFLRNGQLVPIHVPDEEQLIIRENTRQREAFTAQLRVARQKVLAMLRRYGHRFTQGKLHWTKMHWHWLRGVKMTSLGLQEVLLEYIDHVETLMKKIADIDAKLERIPQQWTKAPIAKGLATLRGVDTYTATTLVAEIDEFSRFETAGEFMSYLGLTPTEFSSGERVTKHRVSQDKVRRGPITKAGNGRVRRLLIEAAWSYRHLPRRYKALMRRWKGQPQQLTDHAFKAQKRLYTKYRKLVESGKPTQVVNVAIARELAGFVWAIGIMAESLQNAPKRAV